ncbi:peptide ABC transporter substrate-binding protein, partial [Paenibacillus sp. MWE-103]|nr:peptide ABC transporter substrate-binding protein [Paenibacillus artemisiicola]
VAPADELFARPAHPYTQALMSAIPQPSPGRQRDRVALQGEVPSPVNPPSGCRFHPRCPFAQARCQAEEPLARPVGLDREVACHFPLTS